MPQVSVGSNPTPSAMILPGQSRLFLFYEEFCMTELELTKMVEKAKRWAVEAHAG